MDYRKYLNECFDSVKNNNKRVSFRWFAREAKFTSPNFFQLLLEGKRNLNLNSIESISRLFKMNRKEKGYFLLLVSYDQSKTFEEKNSFYNQILKYRIIESVKPIEIKQYQYFNKWFHPVIRELVVHQDYTGSPEWIMEHLFPKITISQIEKSIKLLKELELIRWDDKKKNWQQTNKVISTPSEVQDIITTSYHKNLLELASQALENFKQTERDFRSVTLGLNKKGYKDVKIRFKNFWNEILEIAGNQDNMDSAYQINIQLFPWTKKEKGND